MLLLDFLNFIFLVSFSVDKIHNPLDLLINNMMK